MLLLDSEVVRIFLEMFGFWFFLLLRFILEKYVSYKTCSSDFALSNKKKFGWFQSRQNRLRELDIFPKTFASYIISCTDNIRTTWYINLMPIYFTLQTSSLKFIFIIKITSFNSSWTHNVMACISYIQVWYIQFRLFLYILGAIRLMILNKLFFWTVRYSQRQERVKKH